jgi:uncharacterized protein YndB with AHSA1/START domain
MTAEASTFLYVTFIRTTPDKLWTALTQPDFIHRYWFGMTVKSDFTAGSEWSLGFEDGRLADSGEILEADPPRRLVIKWRNEFKPELTAEGWSQCAFDMEPVEDAVKLTVTHTAPVPDSQLIVAVSGGWPRILSNLKSLLETGEVVLKG